MLLFATSYIRWRLDDVPQLVWQIILTSHRTTSDTGVHRGKGDRHDCQDYSFQMRVPFRMTKEMKIVIRHLFEYSIHFSRCNKPSIRLRWLDFLWPCQKRLRHQQNCVQTSSSSLVFLYWRKSFRPSFRICALICPHLPWPLVFGIHTFFPGVIRFTNRLAFAMLPHDPCELWDHECDESCPQSSDPTYDMVSVSVDCLQGSADVRLDIVACCSDGEKMKDEEDLESGGVDDDRTSCSRNCRRRGSRLTMDNFDNVDALPPVWQAVGLEAFC